MASSFSTNQNGMETPHCPAKILPTILPRKCCRSYSFNTYRSCQFTLERISETISAQEERDIEKGRGLIRNALAFTEDLGAEICTFHLWNTLESNFDPAFVQDLFEEAADMFPKLKASVENIPTSLSGKTPIALIKRYQHVTLDTRWAARYGELNAFEPLINRVANVHLRGTLEGERWVLSDSGFHFYDTLHTITDKWRYRGMLTVEPDGEISSSQFSSFIKAMFSLRAKHVAEFD